jgi:hypothetical protein
MNNKSTDKALSSWQVANIRVTSFLSPDASTEGFDSWWQAATNTPPENTSSNHQGQEKIAEGPYADGWLKVRFQPARIDWNFDSPPNKQLSEEGRETLGSYQTAIDVFYPLMKKWMNLDTYPSMQRLAFGIELIEPTNSRETGYERLKDYLSSVVAIDAENSSDFSYKINRPRPSSVISEFKVNRLSIWSTQRLESTLFSMPLGQQQQSRSVGKGPTHFYVRLALDINTDQSYDGQFDAEHSILALDELLSFSKEIAMKGDIA